MRAVRAVFFTLGLTMAATAAHAAPDGAWHLAGADKSGAWAYAEPPKATSLILIAMRMREPQPGDNGTPAYNGAMFIEELDCTNQKARAIKQVYYDASSATVNTVDTATGWKPLSQSNDLDFALYAKCNNKPMPDKGQQIRGDDTEAQKWLAGLITAAAALAK